MQVTVIFFAVSGYVHKESKNSVNTQSPDPILIAYLVEDLEQ